jgi:hypothetical protein
MSIGPLICVWRSHTHRSCDPLVYLWQYTSCLTHLFANPHPQLNFITWLNNYKFPWWAHHCHLDIWDILQTFHCVIDSISTHNYAVICNFLSVFVLHICFTFILSLDVKKQHTIELNHKIWTLSNSLLFSFISYFFSDNMANWLLYSL